MKNEYKVTKKLMMSWAHLTGSADIILFVLWSIVGVGSLGRIILLSVFGGDWVNWYISILFLLLAVFKLFFSRFIVMSNRYKLLAKTYGTSEWLRTIEFTDDEIISTDHNSVVKFQYTGIKKIKETKNSVLIIFNTNLGIRLYKDAFVEGSWEECKAKIYSLISK